jgi:hypothetical protein
MVGAHGGNVASYDIGTNTLKILRLIISDEVVTTEARRWTRGSRAERVDDLEQLSRSDLSPFVTEALRIGAMAISVTGSERESVSLERLLKDVGDRTAESSTKAAELTQKTVRDAADVVAKASESAKVAMAEVDLETRKHFTANVSAAKTELNGEIQRLFGGENPELLDKLRPLLDKFAIDLDSKVSRQTGELLEKAAKQFDPADPTSPMAKHAADLATQQAKLTALMEKNHTELANKVEELTTALKVEEARRTLAKVTPIKGGSFEDEIHTIMLEIAGGLGDEYADTSRIIGHLSRCKKGDGLLTVDGGSTRVVLEMTDSARIGWGAYFDEAERNRAAAACLGLVRTSSQNGDQTIRVLGARRVVMAFDPQQDDPELLRTVVMLLRTVAIAATVRTGGTEIAKAEEKITEALAQLAKIASVKKLASSIQKSAMKIDEESTGLHDAIHRLLDQALGALAGTGEELTTPPVRVKAVDAGAA